MDQAAEVPQRKGTINRCPSCGVNLIAFSAACGACGHEFTDIDANRSITSLVERFDAIEREIDAKALSGRGREQELLSRKARVIRDFPVPNSRDDLQQLLYFIKPKIVPSVKPDPNIEDWRTKFVEVIDRARKAYKDDAAALADFDRIEQSLASTLGNDLKIKAKRNPLFVAMMLGLVALGSAWGVSAQMQSSQLRECEDRYERGAALELARLEKIYASIDQQRKDKKFAEGMATSTLIRWDHEEASCKIAESGKAKAGWEQKRSQLVTLIQATADASAAEAQREVDRQLAIKQAEDREAVALATALADKAAAAAAAGRQIATNSATATRKSTMDKAW